MKTLLVFLLLAIASCNTEIQEIQEPELEFDVSGLIKCISEVAPLVPEVIEIINFVKAADWAQVAIKAVETITKIIPAAKECIAAFKKSLNLESQCLPMSNNCAVTCTQLYTGLARTVCMNKC